MISFVSETDLAAEGGRNSPPPLIEFADAPPPTNIIVDSGEEVGGGDAERGRGDR